MVSLLAFVVLLLMLLKLYISRSNTKQPALINLPPGPWQLPLIGSLHHFLLSSFRDLPHRAMREMSKTYGPLMLLRLGTVPMLVVSSAEAAKEILKIHDLTFCSRPMSPTRDIISRGGQGLIFCPYNERWRELRKICMLELLNQRRVLQFRSVREDEVARLVRAISSECSSGQPINLSEKLNCLVSDITVRITTGDRLDHRDEFLREVDNASRLGTGFSMVDSYPSSRLVRWLSTTTRDLERCQRNIYRIIESIIRERATASAVARDNDILSVLLRLQKDSATQFTLTNEIIAAFILDIFAAGSDTASVTLEWAFSELIKNPRVLHKAQSEVRDVFKGQHTVTEDNLDKLSYLHLVIKETLRLHPPATFFLRECRETCRIIGYDVPKGMAIAVNVWAIGRDTKSWDAAEEFRPERFDNSNIDFKGNNFEYIPFGAGRRICPGITFASAIMELALASLLYHFDWELPAGVNTYQFDMTEAAGASVEASEAYGSDADME
ncbi:hypothetical protein PR202_gb12493 [Eleusine coracana subsp. coracana]|uniref:Cytochrome P450 n=1 Tax=Eleusine coracana subsp. coracana TaxID=191504 RepID=A0AAV5ER84_ELECO|nr:hypothetical protein PR202_gb12493 [Eleusine coracana subsp. coracana]